MSFKKKLRLCTPTLLFLAVASHFACSRENESDSVAQNDASSPSFSLADTVPGVCDSNGLDLKCPKPNPMPAAGSCSDVKCTRLKDPGDPSVGTETATIQYCVGTKTDKYCDKNKIKGDERTDTVCQTDKGDGKGNGNIEYSSDGSNSILKPCDVPKPTTSTATNTGTATQTQTDTSTQTATNTGTQTNTQTATNTATTTMTQTATTTKTQTATTSEFD